MQETLLRFICLWLNTVWRRDRILARLVQRPGNAIFNTKPTNHHKFLQKIGLVKINIKNQGVIIISLTAKGYRYCQAPFFIQRLVVLVGLSVFWSGLKQNVLVPLFYFVGIMASLVILFQWFYGV